MADFEHLKRLCARRKQVGSALWIDGNKSSMNAKVEIDRIDGLIVEEVMKLYEKDDVVEVVRCKDCKLMCHDEHGYWCINDYQACLDPEKDYCSRAERRLDNG